MAEEELAPTTSTPERMWIHSFSKILSACIGIQSNRICGDQRVDSQTEDDIKADIFYGEKVAV